MEVFEVHITGDDSILASATQLGIKTITVDLLKPTRGYFRTEYMTSQVMKCSDYKDCKARVDELVLQLTDAGTKIVRIKIESPFYPHYAEQSLYMESHFEAESNLYPMSRNRKKITCLATDREYYKDGYESFIDKYQGQELELCLFDSFADEDKDWFDLYETLQPSNQGGSQAA